MAPSLNHDACHSQLDRNSSAWPAHHSDNKYHHTHDPPQGRPRTTAFAASATAGALLADRAAVDSGSRARATGGGARSSARSGGVAVAATVTAAATEASPERYAVLIDAGSSGSRVHVYKYRPAQGRRRGGATPYPVVQLPARILRTHPGLSEFAPDGEGVEESLGPLIRFAQEQVPRWPEGNGVGVRRRAWVTRVS